MKIIKTIYLSILLIGLSFIVGGCILSNQRTPTFIFTAEAIKASPTVQNMPTDVSPIPTLAPKNAYSIISNFLKNDLSCQLPCWLGIMPGKSTVLDIQMQFTAFSSIAKRMQLGDAGESWTTIEFDYPSEDSVVNIRSAYWIPSNEDQVAILDISTQVIEPDQNNQIYDDLNYQELLAAYSLPQILATYGIPDQIFVTAEIYMAEPTAPDYMKIRLIYPKMGIFARYTMLVETGVNTYKFCPSKAFINLNLIPQEVNHNYKEYFMQTGNTEWDPPTLLMPFHKSTEDAIGITNEEFYRTITSSPDKCFESPINIWPEP